MIITPIGDGFAAECSDIDITQPLPDAAIAAIEAGIAPPCTA